MYQNFNPIEEFVNTIKGNTNFLNRLLTPKISVPLFALCILVIGLFAIVR